MTLEFNPSPYLQLYQQDQNRRLQGQQLGAESLNSIPQALIQYSQQNQQNQRQKMMDQLVKQENLRKWGDPNQVPMDNSMQTPPGQNPTSLFGQNSQRTSMIDQFSKFKQQPKPVAFDKLSYPEMLKGYGTEGIDSYSKYLTAQNKDQITPYQKAELGIMSKKFDFTTGTKENQQQDKLEQQARQSVTNLRGDKSLARAEEQRDAAIVAYNRLNEIEKSGQLPNPVDYVDILGQIYKARTGSAPTNEIFQQARQDTAQGKFGKWYTYFTGQQAPATTQNIASSLKSMAGSMGSQADNLHEGYMKSHLIKPMGLEDNRWQPILSSGRGISFQDATGYSDQSGNFDHQSIPVGTVYQAPDGTMRRKQ